ncbi:capsid protein [Paenibacillus sp. FSL L8-0708]|uniref:capsid protein n=1 Tax=Paenibacillus sp. FSL L8-0708 TaxID=2975311 RepID=UPI0030FBFB87
MPYNYVDSFQTVLQQKYTKELTSSGLTTQNANFLNAKTIKVPRLDVAGYKNHSRNGGWNRQGISNDFELKVLTFDRDVEFYVDAMDVDETNQIVSAANLTTVFEAEQAIPELDKYRYSKIYADYVALGKIPDTTVLTVANALLVFDKLMQNMDEAEVPQEGRILYVTPTTHTLLKQAEEMKRVIQVQNNNGVIDRAVRQLDDVTLIKVPSSRMKTIYDFTNGAVPGVGAKQINMIMIHPQCVLAPIKHTAIYLWEPGSHTGGDGYLYQNRRYTDLFLINRKADGIQINAEGGE